MAEEIRSEFINGNGGFFLFVDNEQLGEMTATIDGNEITVFHTGVQPKAEGKGYAKKLLQAMAEYSRQNKLQVIPLCPYVLLQFKRNAELYADIWKQDTAK